MSSFFDALMAIPFIGWCGIVAAVGCALLVWLAFCAIPYEDPPLPDPIDDDIVYTAFRATQEHLARIRDGKRHER